MSLRDCDKNTIISSRKRFSDDKNAFTDNKEQCRKVLNADIQAFLKAGGVITQVSRYESAYPEKERKHSFVPDNYKDAKI
jgi:hypothetical protein